MCINMGRHTENHPHQLRVLHGYPPSRVSVPNAWKHRESRSEAGPRQRIGWVGTGFVIQEAIRVVESTLNPLPGRILTRRSLNTVKDFSPNILTNSVEELIEHSDLICEASGDVIYASEVIEKALKAGRPVLTMNPELHITTGSYLQTQGFLSEAQGTLSSALALLHDEALQMGFEPIAYGGVQNTLKHRPSREDMVYLSRLQGQSLAKTVATMDGTRIQTELALAANGLGADIPENGLTALKRPNIFDTDHMVEMARNLGRPITDFIVSPGATPGAFVLAHQTAHERFPNYTPYQRLRTKGDSAYVLLRAHQLGGLEIAKSLEPLLNDLRKPLLSNGPTPRISVAAVAKRPLDVDTILPNGSGSFEVRGVCIRTADHPIHVPIGLLPKARLKRKIEPGQMISFEDIELPETRALSMWLDVVEQIEQADGPVAQAVNVI